MRARRLIVSLVTLALSATTLPSYAGGETVRYPAYHRVQQGESMWSIARDFLLRATGHEPRNDVVSSEVRQMRRLNRDELGGSDRIYPGQRLLLAPTTWDVPDGKDGWGTGFTWCTNDRLPAHASAPHHGLKLHVRLLKPPVDRRSEPIRLVIRNRSDHTRRFSTQLEHGLLRPKDGSATAVMHTDAIGVGEWKLRPGERMHVDGWVSSFVCGDTRYLDRRLSPGVYRLYGIAVWRSTRRATDRWVSPARTVRLVLH